MINIVRKSYPLILLLLIIALTGVFVPFDISRVQAAARRTLAWSIVDTPSDNVNGMIIRPSGINSFALGQDGKTFYAADTANNGFYKSTDAGYGWLPNIKTNLLSKGAALPVWNVVVAPDDANMVLAVTDGSGAPNGPKNLFFSADGGGTWQNTSFPALAAGEYISCLDISKKYVTTNQACDIAVGTRSTAGTGRIFNFQYSTSAMGTWNVQTGLTDSISSLKFSPNYDQECVIAVISCTAANTKLNLGLHDTSTNTTLWNALAGYTGYPIIVSTTLLPPVTFNAANTIVTDLELPSDFSASDLSLRGCFASILAVPTSAVFYINSNILPAVINITPFTATAPRGIYSIAYKGTAATGILLAGEATTTVPGRVNVWQCSNPQATTVGAATWLPSDNLKSPTGGGNTGGGTVYRANAILAWLPDAENVYCATNSEKATAGGTAWAAGQWPYSKLNSVALDESAFSYSADNGFAWNQIGLINTRISQLSDVAAYEKAVDAISGSNALYLASLNTESVPNSFDSVWRSTSDPLGLTWERVLIWRSSDNGMILRINPRDTTGSSKVIVFADLTTNTIIHSSDEGNLWSQLLPGMPVTDISLLDDTTMYVLGDYTVRKLPLSGQPGKPLNTELLSPGHTICTPLTPSTGSEGTTQEIVVIGTGGNDDCYVAWADFAEPIPKFTALKELPVQGDVHVVTDDQYDRYQNVYAGITNIDHDDGNIYRWTIGTIGTIGTSTNWDELDPINRSFFGICMLNDILYGAWNTDITSPLTSTGVDRTLDARVRVPPPPEWDELRDGLPNSLVYPKFTREPTSLHASSNAYNTLWAIDDHGYAFTLKQGCLWQYVDSVAKLGPWPTAPPPGGFIGSDPSTGRAQQIDFKWRPLKDIFGYDVMIAKDVNFTLLLSRVLMLTPVDNLTGAWIVTPVDNLTGAWIVTPADQESPSCWISPGVLEVGRSYYWRVRGSRSISGTKIHSPWSATMFFSVKPGFRVTADYMGPTLLTPVDGICGNCKPPIRFSWSPIKAATKYEIVLATDAELKNVVMKTTTTTTGFDYKDKLEFSKSYFWQVKAIAPVISDPSPVGTFTLSENKTTLQNALLSTINFGAFPALSSLWIWIIIVIVAVLLFMILAYIFISRRRY